jgi:carboxypeptidase Taq
VTDIAYDRFIVRLKEVKTLSAVASLLSWDQETYMPPKGAEARAEQLALISGLAHKKFVSDEMGALLGELAGPAASGGLDPERAANVREAKRLFDRERKLSTELVEEIAKTQSLAHEAWILARKRSDFAHFAPWLEKNIALQKKVAELVGYEKEPYDALLDVYEPGARVGEIAPLFESLREKLVPLVARIAKSGRRAPKLEGRFSQEKQREFAVAVARDMGFDFDAGRLDVSAHPFCSGLHPLDVRMTTRYDESDFRGALFGVMHEAGHGLYEQGLLPRHAGTPMGEAASTAIHESQSRMWENFVGRSRPFWRHYYPKLQEAFPEPLSRISFEDFYFGINEVEPSLIRVEADEVTYNLHILLRFEIEQGLFSGRIAVSDLPSIWNRKMEEYLGIVPPDDARGVLQDTHWSCGLFGYFPTYTLGNLYAAQFYAQARKEIPDLEEAIGRGELRSLRDWLRDRIHKRGMLFRPQELCREVTGKALDPSHFFEYLEQKFGEIYGLSTPEGA